MSAAYCRIARGHLVHAYYHDAEYGFPARDERVLFERLLLEINQAGLSWLTILNKRAAFRADFDIDRVTEFGPADFDRLLADPGIVRNRTKIRAVIDNAHRIQALRGAHGSFAGWLDAHHPRPLEAWTRLFRKNFRFTGGLIVNEFLMSLGYLTGAHEADCPVFARISALSPPWARAGLRVLEMPCLTALGFPVTSKLAGVQARQRGVSARRVRAQRKSASNRGADGRARCAKSCDRSSRMGWV